MNREEIIVKIQNNINKFYKNCKSIIENERELLSEIFDDVEKLRRPVTLAEFLGWEEDVEYEFFDKTLYKAIDNNLYSFNTTTKEWYFTSFDFCNYDISQLRQAKKVEQNKFYAKVKGADLINNNKKYWNVDTKNSYLYVGNQMETHRFTILLTKEEWNKLGINDSNADFEVVE